MSVENLNAADSLSPLKLALRLEKRVRDVNDAVRGLRGLAMLLDGYEQSEIEPMYVLGLLDPIEQNLRAAAEDLDTRHDQLVRALGGNAGSKENDVRLCQLHGEFKSLWDRVLAEGEKPGPACRRQDEIVREMLQTPADTYVGVAAKIATATEDRGSEPESLGDKLEWRAARELERFGGFGSQQQAAE